MQLILSRTSSGYALVPLPSHPALPPNLSEPNPDPDHPSAVDVSSGVARVRRCIYTRARLFLSRIDFYPLGVLYQVTQRSHAALQLWKYNRNSTNTMHNRREFAQISPSQPSLVFLLVSFPDSRVTIKACIRFKCARRSHNCPSTWDHRGSDNRQQRPNLMMSRSTLSTIQSVCSCGVNSLYY